MMCTCHSQPVDDPNCDEQGRTSERKTPAESVIHADRHLLGLIVPGILLGLAPKCPACLAAYIALATGLSVSVSVASHLRFLLIAICFATVSVFVWSRIRDWVNSRSLGESNAPEHNGADVPLRPMVWEKDNQQLA